MAEQVCGRGRQEGEGSVGGEDVDVDGVRQQMGQTVRVLVEGYGRSDGTLSGRLDNNLTVEFAADPALMGSYAQVHLTGARATVLLGELET